MGSAAIAQPLRAMVASRISLERVGFIIEEKIVKAFQKQAM
jgi:hypothetical protein